MAIVTRSRQKIRRFFELTFHEQLDFGVLLWHRFKAAVYYRHIFRSFGQGSILFTPTLLAHPEFIRIGNNVTIRKGIRLEVVVSDLTQPPELIIGNNVNIEQNVHIVCHSRVVIGDDVSITGNCAIVDITHPYEDVSDKEKIGARILAGPSHVVIGNRCFLGYGSIILPDVCIGEYCIIGALALVTSDVPDYSVVAGTPARIIRRYDRETDQWVAFHSGQPHTSAKD